MAEYLIQDTTLDAIADAINAKTGGSSAMTPAEMVTAIAAIPSGTTITDGIVVKARNADGYATEIEYHGTTVYRAQFSNRTTEDGTWIYLTNISFADAVTTIEDNALSSCGRLTSLSAPSLSYVGGSAMMNCIGITDLNLPELTSTGIFSFAAMTSLSTVVFPKLTTLNRRLLAACTALTSVQLGSVGYGITSVNNEAFYQATQSGLMITIFTTGSYADTAVSNIRNGATNATIIIKASEATTYGGNSYAVGDTILTSEVTA